MRGQFLIISAIVIGVMILGVAGLMSQIHQEEDSPSSVSSDIEGIKFTAKALEVTEESDRAVFEYLMDRRDYSYSMDYWEEEECVNVTLNTNTGSYTVNCLPEETEILESLIMEIADRDEFETGDFSGTTAERGLRTLEDSVNSANGIILGPEWHTGDWKGGYALNFEEGDAVSIRDQDNLEDEGTLVLTARGSYSDSGKERGFAFQHREVGDDRLYIKADNEDADDEFVARVGDSDQVVIDGIDETEKKRLAVTWDDGDITTYVNGQLQNTGFYDEGVDLSAGDWVLGAYQSAVGGFIQHFEGEIDNVVVSDQAVSETELQQDYESQPWAGNEDEDLPSRIHHWKVDQDDAAIELGHNFENGDDILGFWRFDREIPGDGGEVHDYSGEENHGETVSGVSTGADGVFSSKSFSYDGSSPEHVDLGADINFNDDDMAVSAWIYPEMDGQRTDGRIIAKGDGISTEDHWYDLSTQYNSEEDVRFRLRTDDGTEQHRTFSEPLEEDVWHHVAVTYDGSEVKIYVDGELERSSSQTGDIIGTTDHPAYIGDHPDVDRPWDGRIDELVLFDSSLSEQDVQELYIEGKPFFGEYFSVTQDLDESETPTLLEVDSTVPSDDTEAQVTVTHDSGEEDTVELDEGVNHQNYTLDIPETGGEIEIEANLESEKESLSPALRSIRVWSTE